MRRLALVAILLSGASSALAAQGTAPRGGRCPFDYSFDHPFSADKTPSGNRNVFSGGNVVAKCRTKGIVVTSDSIEYYGDEGRTVLIGHATYKEPRLQLKSDILTYFENDERVLAVQHVDGRLPSGSTIQGPQLEFLRAVPRLRPQQFATATGRPTIDLVEKDAQGRTQPPVKVTGNTVWLIGDSIVSSSGNVVVVRPQLTATGDSIYGDATTGLLRIMRTPKITGTKGRPFTLVGETIDLLTRQRKLDRVLAKSKAEAQSEDLNLKSDTIDMRITDDLLQRAIVWGKSRAFATSPSQSIVADSIDVLLPGQRVREMHAIRRAVAEGIPDTTKFVFQEKDRLTGDTIVARFDSIPAKDTASRPRIHELHAIGHATSLRSTAPRDTTLCKPMVVYTRGQRIDIVFKAGAVDSVKAINRDSLARGVEVEPTADSTNRCSVLRPRATTPPAKPATPPPAPAPPASTPVALPATGAAATRRP